MNAVSRVRDLYVRDREGTRIVGPVDIDLRPGTVHSLVGESGSGKTLTLRSLGGVLPSGLVSDTGESTMPPAVVIFQDPYSAFNPRWRIVRSLREVLVHGHGREHRRRWLQDDIRRRIVTLADHVGLEYRELQRYPFQLSGGMVQRAAIAMALATDPSILLADEITSAVDPERARRILRLLREIAIESGIAILLVSHDLPLVAEVSDDVRVLYRGVVVERGSPATVLARPRHPYTAMLVHAIPTGARRGTPLPEIAPATTDPWSASQGCPFVPRCPAATGACGEMPDWDESGTVRCFYPVTKGRAGDG